MKEIPDSVGLRAQIQRQFELAVLPGTTEVRAGWLAGWLAGEGRGGERGQPGTRCSLDCTVDARYPPPWCWR